MRRPASLLTGALLFIIGGLPTPVFSQDLLCFSTEIEETETPATATVAEADPPSQSAALPPAEPEHTRETSSTRRSGDPDGPFS